MTVSGFGSGPSDEDIAVDSERNEACAVPEDVVCRQPPYLQGRELPGEDHAGFKIWGRCFGEM